MSIDEGTPRLRSIRSAVFVDFDNVYSGLRRLDPSAAETTATNPSVWLAALGSGADHEGPFQRRFLICSCYLNPSVHSLFRPFYTRAGFKVIDCPSLTQQGKSSADINLVLDVVDALGSSTRYDEFLLLSADADFTPLALRLRAQDRRVTVVLAGPGAGAYKSVADAVVEPDAFAQQLAGSGARGIEEEGFPSLAEVAAVGSDIGLGRRVDDVPSRAPALPDLEIAQVDDDPARRAVITFLESSAGPIPGARLAAAALKASPGLQETQWLGHRTFAAWLDSRVPIAGHGADGSGHFVWDNRRVTAPDTALTAGSLDQVAAVTDTPALAQEQYAALITALADEVNAHPFDRIETSKRVRDSCNSAGSPVGRKAVNFVIQGLVFAGVSLAAPVQREELASAWADNVLGLCRAARMELDAETESEIRRWVSGGLARET